ncbi:MAG: hypothetical protein RLZZ546_2601 [Bacteroidota bacterium]|jgi:hypothetical protein
MILFIPDIGSKIHLTKDWTFVLYDEYRNSNVFQKLGLNRGGNTVITIPKGTVLTTKRIYIKQNSPQYSSITFSIAKKDSVDKRLWSAKFWVSLNDANKIEFELSECNEELRKSIVDWLFEAKQHVGSTYNQIEALIIENKSLTKFRPLEDGYSFYMTVISKLKNKIEEYKNYIAEPRNQIYTYGFNKSIEAMEKTLEISSKYFRKFKINKFVEDSNSEEVNEKETV